MILVAGATGLVGSEVCRRLMSRGERVRALVRALVRATSSKEKVEALRSSGVELLCRRPAAKNANVERFLFVSFRRTRLTRP